MSSHADFRQGANVHVIHFDLGVGGKFPFDLHTVFCIDI